MLSRLPVAGKQVYLDLRDMPSKCQPFNAAWASSAGELGEQTIQQMSRRLEKLHGLRSGRAQGTEAHGLALSPRGIRVEDPSRELPGPCLRVVVEALHGMLGLGHPRRPEIGALPAVRYK